MSRVTIGFLVAPLAPAAIYGALGQNPISFIFAALWAYPFALVLGAPTYYFMRTKGWLRLWQVMAASALLGLVSFVIFWLFSVSGHDPWRVILFFAAIFIASATLSGITFWAVALRARASAL